LNQGALEGFTDNIKPDRTAEDLLFQVMLDWGVDLALPITRQTIQGREVLFVDSHAQAAARRVPRRRLRRQRRQDQRGADLQAAVARHRSEVHLRSATLPIRMDSAALTTLLHALVVTEQPARLVFENEGGFYEGQPLDYLEGHKIPRRYFPMPDYDLSDAGAVKLAIHGGVVDPAYSRLLIQKTDLPLADVLALDRVQKKLPIPDEAAARLRRAGLIEGRKPEYHVSAQVAAATDQKADYIRTRAQDDEFYAKLLTDYLQRYGGATRSEINRLLLPKLSEALSAEQKDNKIANLLTQLRRTNRIHNSGTRARPVWRLVP
jgi:hypothetical protein